MAKTYTLKDLQGMTPQQRHQLNENAKRLKDKGGAEIMKLIAESGLSMKAGASGGTKTTDPVYERMREIIFSTEGRKAAREAADGVPPLPAMAGIDKILRDRMPIEYTADDQIAVSAGSLTGELMRELGYKKGKQRPLPDGCIAKTAVFWISLEHK